MDPYAHATTDQLVEILHRLYETIHVKPEEIQTAWERVPLQARAAAGDLDALDELHGG